VYYKLNPDLSVEPVASLDELGGQAGTKLASDTVRGCTVSTVFLAIDHNHGEGEPLIFETMVFDEGFNELHCQRTSTYTEAMACHYAVKQKIKASWAWRPRFD